MFIIRLKSINRLLLVSLFLFASIGTHAAFIQNIPTTITNPDGAVISCFSSGDEFFNYLHDSDGFTIIIGDDGFYYYGVTKNGIVVPSEHRVNEVSPKSIGIKPFALISEAEYQKRVNSYWEGVPKNNSKAPHTGQMNNIVIYIRFQDDEEFTTARSIYDYRLNAVTGPSMKHYFQEVSYNNLLIESHHYPIADLSTNLSYKDNEPRSYYQPYHATNNPNGYNGSTERRTREHGLLQRAVQAVESEIPSELLLDADGDGNVDNVCFIIRGNAEGWSDLLWAHRWVLYTHQVYINGKRVYDYTFQPENQTQTYVLAHEMFHTLSAPDLYRYSQDGFVPVGPWDLMASGFVHMGAFMKYKYANGIWISEIPEITEPGEYNLKPLTSADNNAFKIKSPYSDSEYFVLEYRKKEGNYESTLPASGLLVYRINTFASNGNANGPPDEVHLYRPGGTPASNGNINAAALSANNGLTAINDYTDPSTFLSDGSYGGLNIYDISEAGETISFTVGAADRYLIGFKANPLNAGFGFDKTNQSPYLLESEVMVTAVNFPGYKFVNWTNEEQEVVSESKSFTFTMPEGNILLTANFEEATKYSINFSVKDESSIPVEDATILIETISEGKSGSTTTPTIREKTINSNSSILSNVQLFVLNKNESIPFKANNNDEGLWIHWDNGTNHTAIGTNSPAQFSIASRWTPADLQQYDGMEISKISFFPREVNCTYTLKIWLGPNAVEFYSQNFSSVQVSKWNIIELDEPFKISSLYDLWFGVYINTQAGYPAGVDQGPSVVGKGDLMTFGDGWFSMQQKYGLNYNWNLQAFVVDPGPRLLKTDNFGETSLMVESGKYSYTVEKSGYESASGEITLEDQDVDENIVMSILVNAETISWNDLSVYPNPFNESLIINSPKIITNIKIINTLGQQVIDFNVGGTNFFKLNTEDLSFGLYFLKIDFYDGSTLVRRIVK